MCYNHAPGTTHDTADLNPTGVQVWQHGSHSDDTGGYRAGMNGTLYEERILSKWNFAIMGIVIIGLLVALVWQMVEGPVGTDPAPNWLLIALVLVFLAIGANFATLSVRVDLYGVTAGYGIIRHNVSWGNIAGCHLDGASAVRYGGWGIRTGWVDGKKRLVYNIIGTPRVVVEKRQGKYDEFVFSTRHPEAVIKAINEGIGKRS